MLIKHENQSIKFSSKNGPQSVVARENTMTKTKN